MLGLLLSLLATSTSVLAASSKPAGFGQRPAAWIKYDVPNDFFNPKGLARPTFRYWVPDADVNNSVLYSDLAEIRNAGWGGAEVICLENYGIEPAVVDPALYGYGGDAWRDKFNTMLNAANGLDLNIDLSLGPTQGASIPILDPDTPGMNTELCYGTANLTSGTTFTGALPPPGKTDPGYANAPDFYPPAIDYTNKFVAAVVVAKSVTSNADNRTVQLDYSTAKDITSFVHDGQVNYTAPDDGKEYVLFSFYQRRTGYIAAQGAFNNATSIDNPASWTAYVVDHFSQEGTDLWTQFTEQYVMEGENADLIRQLGLYAWEDSAEFRALLFWTDNFAQYFEQTRNYSIITALPALFGTTGLPPSTLANGYYYFAYDDTPNGTDIGWKLRNDFYQTLQELYEMYHLDGLSKWSATWGLQGSLQPYATAPNLAPPWDMNSAAAHIDAPETESNYFDGVIDAFRAMGGGAMMGQKQIFSTELGAHRYESYAITWPVILNDCAIDYAGGVNRIVTHGYPYSGSRPDAEWPGLTTFEWLYSEMWGPRQPSWKYVREMSDWIARTQLILQNGIPRVDIGIYRHKYLSVDIKHYKMPENIFGDLSLQNAGYSYVSVSPSLLTQDNAVVTDGLLANDGPGFSAFIVDNSTNITTQAVDRFLEYAKRGFAILFVGPVPETTPYYCDSCDAYVKDAVAELLKLPSVKSLAREADVVPALEDLGVLPAARNLYPAPIIYVHRKDRDSDVDYFWVYNSDIYSAHATSASIKAIASSIPYILDAWTGIITPVVNYTYDNATSRFTTYFSLQSNQSTIIAFAPGGFFSSVQVPSLHATATDFEYLNYSATSNSLIGRSFSNTTKYITLSDGTTHTFTSPSTSLPEAATLGPWNLTIQDWLPNPDPKNNYTSVFAYHTVTLDELIPWYNISGLQNVSGIGFYSTSFTWSPTSSSDNTSNSTNSTNSNPSYTNGAYLDLGPVFNTIRLFINSHWTGPIDITDAVVDISPWLVEGVNEVRVETSSTLRNRLLQVNVTQSWEQSEYAGSYGGQPYGLQAPVVLRPFWEVGKEL